MALFARQAREEEIAELRAKLRETHHELGIAQTAERALLGRNDRLWRENERLRRENELLSAERDQLQAGAPVASARLDAEERRELAMLRRQNAELDARLHALTITSMEADFAGAAR